MYSRLPAFILGFHGCDREVGERVLRGDAELRVSSNTYDWLGHGVYFWEQNPRRAWDYACLLRDDPGRCLNLTESDSHSLLAESHALLVEERAKAGKPLPSNKTVGEGDDLLLRDLDCAVVELLHSMLDRAEKPPFETARGMYSEGNPVYEGTDIRAKTHIQVCVRDLSCIKGYFRPRGVKFGS